MADYDLQYQDTYIDTLLATVNELKSNGYIFKGVATPTTNPGTTTEKCAYIASEAGTYTNFGSLVVTGLSVLTYNGSAWSASLLDVSIDVEQTIGQSTTAVMSQKAVTDELELVDKSEISFTPTNNVVYSVVNSHIKPSTNTSWKAAPAINVVGWDGVSINFYTTESQAAHSLFTDANGAMVGERLWNTSGDYKDFSIPSGAVYLYTSTNKSVQAAFGVKRITRTSLKEKIGTLDDLSCGTSINENSDVEISDVNNHIILQLKGGHVKTKNFDSSLVYDALGKFSGKHIAIIGDSVSTYQGYIPTGWKTHYTSSNLASVNLTYWWKLCNALGMTYNNCSYSTSRASGNSQATSVSGGDGECAGCSDVRIAALNRDGKTPDIVLIELGINDWANNVSIGTFCEGGTLPAEGVINSFSDAYALMINKIRTLYPTVRIFCCTVFSNLARETTPPFRGGSSPYTNGNTLYSYNKTIREVARIMGCDVIDLAACGINNISTPTTTHDSKVHPNADGFALMFKKIMTEIISKY